MWIVLFLIVKNTGTNCLFKFLFWFSSEGKISPDEPAILPPLPIVPKNEKRRHMYGTPQPKRIDYRDRDWDRERDRDFELMPPPGSHRKDFATPVDVDQPIDPNEPTYCVCHQVWVSGPLFLHSFYINVCDYGLCSSKALSDVLTCSDFPNN